MRWSHTQRNGRGGTVNTLPTHATHCQVHALAARIHAPRPTPHMRLDMVQATYRSTHRRARCQHSRYFGLEQSVHNLRRHDHVPVGGEWLGPLQVIGMTALTLRVSQKGRQLSQTVLDQPRTVARVHNWKGPEGPHQIRSGPALTSVSTPPVCLVKRDEQKVMA